MTDSHQNAAGLIDIDRARVGATLELLRRALATFLEAEFRAKYGEAGPKRAAEILGLAPPGRGAASVPLVQLDVAELLRLMFDGRTWNDLFAPKGYAKWDRSLVSELQGLRIEWAHQRELTAERIQRGIQTARLLLELIGAPEAAQVLMLQTYRFEVRATPPQEPGRMPTNRTIPADALRASLDARFVRECRWNLWREVILDGKGRSVRQLWAIAFEEPQEPSDQVAGVDPRREILCTIYRQPEPYQTPELRAVALILLMPLMWYLGRFITNEYRSLLGMIGLLFGSIVMLVGVGTQHFLGRGLYSAATNASQWSLADWETFKGQVRDLMYAAQVAERAYPRPLLERIARETPQFYLDRAEEIQALYGAENNPIKSPGRREILVDFVTTILSDEFDVVCASREGEQQEGARARLLGMLKSYWETDHEMLQLARRVALHRQLDTLAQDALDQQVRAQDLRLQLHSLIEKDIERMRSEGATEGELERHRAQAAHWADVSVEEYAARDHAVPAKTKAPDSTERGPNPCIEHD